MKKKILSLTLVVCLLAIAVVGGTLAYFTDKDDAKNVFTVGEITIDLHESNKLGAEDEDYQTWLEGQVLVPTTKAKVENVIEKIVTVENTGKNNAYMWAEIWVPAALDDGDDNSPAAPGKGNSLHFNYAKGVVETKHTYLESKEIDGVMYNGYVHYVKDDVEKAKGVRTAALLDQVYMDEKVAQCTDEKCTNENCLVLMDGKTHYESTEGSWNLVVYGVGIQADGFDKITDAITAYYNKDVTAHIW